MSKQLQNNYTTPEQSKRLLELGVPADSADCYHDMSLNRRGVLSINGVYSKDVPYNHLFSDGTHHYLPCWSVGRLIEIICNCHVITNQLVENWICCDKNTNLIELLIRDIEAYKNMQHIDFSKLED